ncbi:hypothetical protein AKJ50_02015 [candidate division MSBL1 archaeon SCGC-AAA382A13]|uniref:Uncharacterized protein n=1 Tax=candidate division MSBL1 archaeon SCGC-AAA382A13 TaxID=1698279 RepID=A0A133VED7_9EURY|nr:hypothetical protein AKJ50_02015 [candidate division MSBL1 archaeon SCGC-AAA382A13]
MRRLQKKLKEENSDLIESFINLQDNADDYEIWVPYFYHGIVGFIDLVVEGGSEISLFKFTRNTKKIEKVVKSLKLEKSVYPKSRNVTSKKNIQSYLVIEDGRKNRKSILSQEELLRKQPFEILFLDKGRNRIESIFELRDSLPRLFQTRNIRLNDEALEELITNPNHLRVERAILNLEDPPDEITGELVKKTERYIKRNDEPPENTESLTNSNKHRTESYGTRTNSDIKKAKQS